MKKIILFCSFAILWYGSFAQTNLIKPAVDPRVELMSTVFRLAEAKEYVNNYFASYAKEVDEFFAPMKAHEIIPYIQKLRQEYFVGYDAVMKYAINLEIRNGTIAFIPNTTNASIDERWTKKNAAEFLDLLNDFYKKSNFQTFFDRHAKMYEMASQNFQAVLNSVDVEWFEKFYGVKSNNNYRVILGLLNGGGNYGPSLDYQDGTRDIFSVMGTWQTDSLGNPAYSPRILSTLIHEFNHSFCNNLIDENIDALYPQAEKFHELVAAQLSQQAYGNATTMLYEILVRACVFQYYKTQYTDEQLMPEIMMSKASGFLWIDELFNALTTYQNSRSTYPTLADFMPEIIKLQNSLSPQKTKDDFDEKCGKIIDSNIKNGTKNVDYNIDHITVKFNQPMFNGKNGTSYGPKGKDFFPEFNNEKESSWTEKEWTVFVNLKPDTEYSLTFPAQFFMTKEGYPILNNYVLEFKTTSGTDRHTQNNSTYLLIGAYSNGETPGISVYDVNLQNGDFTLKDEVKNRMNPSYLAVAPDGKMVYSVNETGQGAVSAFRFDPSAGTLDFVNSQATNGADPCYINIDSQQRFLLTANYTGGNLSVFPLSDNGSIQPATQIIDFNEEKKEPASHIHTVVFSPNQDYVFATDLGKDQITRFHIDRNNSNNLFLKKDGMVTALEKGSGPRHIDFHPARNFAYCINEISGKITALQYTAEGLSPIQSIASDTTTVSEAKGSADIHVSPDGKFLYASNRLQNDGIAIFRIDSTTGLLTFAGYTKTGIHPRNFIISPDGHYLLCANRDSNTVQIFTIDRETGLLNDTGKEIPCDKPVCLKWVPKFKE